MDGSSIKDGIEEEEEIKLNISHSEDCKPLPPLLSPVEVEQVSSFDQLTSDEPDLLSP